MLDYDFHTLSPIEFESLCRDLLQKELNITLESFSAGRDNGIDFRYTKKHEDTSLIVQCKRYTTSFSKLKSHLEKDELPKIKKLNPQQYILTTSLSLNPNQKEAIKILLSPYILNNSDIYTKEDLNNLLGKYKDVESQYYKLWLSSTNILHRILHTDTLNKTIFEQDEILRTVSLYVENESYNSALDIFSKNRFVVISGSPGVGKTTLARMMVYRLLADGEFEQFIYVSRGIEEAIKLYDPEKKQLFFFDDFLGRNYFEKGFDRNEDNDLVKFIERVSLSKNKGLILTTREYILRQAQQQYDTLDAKLIKDSKYVIELEKYTKTIRARILYNHLFSYGVPQEYLFAFINDRTYEYIITHENYSPRLIETVLKDKPWTQIAASQFPDTIKKYFDEPNKLWEDAYTNGVSEGARRLLKILFTLKTPISTTHLYQAFDACNRDLPVRPDYHIFERTIKELENTFIDVRTSTSPKSGTVLLIDYKNPSILDFLLEYFTESKRNDLLAVLSYPVYIDQLILRFSGENMPSQSGQIIMTPEIRKSITQSVLAGFDKLPFCEDDYISRYSFSTKSYRIKTYPQIVHRILNNMGFSSSQSIVDQLFVNYIKFNKSNEQGDFDSESYILELFESKMTDKEIILAIHSISESISSMNDFELFVTHYFPSTRLDDLYTAWLEENEVIVSERAKVIAIETINELDAEELEGYEDTIDYYRDALGLDTTDIHEAYEEAVYEASKAVVDEYDYDDLQPSLPESKEKFLDEDTVIRNMFDSLRN